MTDTQTTPARTRSTWTHGDVAALVQRFHNAPGAAFSERERAKLVELGLESKPAKPVLSDADRAKLDKFVAAMDEGAPEPARTLGIRYVIGKLRELLPKRERNGAT